MTSRFRKGLVTTNEVASFCGIGRPSATSLLEGLDHIVMDGNGTRAYLISDVADALARRKQ